MHNQILIGILMASSGWFIGAWIAWRDRKKYSITEVAISLLLGLEWLYYGGFIAFGMNNKIIDESHKEILGGVVLPLLIFIPLAFMLTFRFVTRNVQK